LQPLQVEGEKNGYHLDLNAGKLVKTCNSVKEKWQEDAKISEQ
jgi:hypothetical protein